MIQSIRGTKDLTPDIISQWQYLEEKCRKITSLFGYKELRTPIFEKTEVFSRSIGEATDIVNKEMYTFTDKGGESVTLRPEMTAALVRSVIQNNLTYDVSTLRLWYFGPFFRYERPQKGRLRQFHQFGAECISSPYPESDAEIIMLANDFINEIGIEKYHLELNSLGNIESRNTYRAALVKYLEANKHALSYDSQQRVESNPLRVLDSKDAKDSEIIKNAPVILDYLDDLSKNHFDLVIKLLESSSISYKIQPTLVRGLDYYSHTVFEFRSDELGAQDAFGGGGRYDGLFGQLGGKLTPAVGFAMGVERLLMILESINKLPDLGSDCDIYIISANEKFISYSNQIAMNLRGRGLRVFSELQRRSFKAQMREADKLKSKYSVLIGENEFDSGLVTIKNLQKGTQETIDFDKLADFIF